MGDTYIGPFGRILPVIDKPDSPPPGRTDPRMLASQVRLPLPTKLNFGSDPRPGFTDPRRYDSSRSRASDSPSSSGSSKHERLPSVNQLLTPASPLPPPEPTGRTPKAEPLTPTEAAARHLYGWSKGYLEGLNPQSGGYFPPQSPRGTPVQYSAASAGQYSARDPYSATGRAPTDPGSGPYISPTSVPPYSARIDARGLPQPMYAAEYGGGRDSLSHRSPDPAISSKPVPKLVGEQVFPGEGPCFVYDDGTHVKKIIDGEAVNAQWGITKAGKPRKRLAIACLTCREKKIKCDPGEPKCVQCEKSGRECRFASARAHRRQ